MTSFHAIAADIIAQIQSDQWIEMTDEKQALLDDTVRNAVATCDINERNNEGMTVLHVVATYPSVRLIPSNQTINRVNCESPELVSALIKYGADVNALDDKKRTPLLACLLTNLEANRTVYGSEKVHNKLRTVEELLRNGACSTLLDKEGNSALREAFKINDKTVELFLKYVPRDVCVAYADNGCVLHAVSVEFNAYPPHFFEKVLDIGVDVNKTKNGRTALHEILNGLSEAMKRITSLEKFSWDVLQYIGVATMLLTRGASLHIRDNFGVSPLDLLLDCNSLNNSIEKIYPFSRAPSFFQKFFDRYYGAPTKIQSAWRRVLAARAFCKEYRLAFNLDIDENASTAAHLYHPKSPLMLRAYCAINQSMNSL